MNPEDFDVTLIDRLVKTFGRHPSEAAKLILKWNWVAGDLDLWEVYLRRIEKDPKVRSPQAVCASLMRKQKHPEAPVPGEERAALILDLLTNYRGCIYHGKNKDHWRIIEQGLCRLEEPVKVLHWQSMLLEDIRKVRTDVAGQVGADTQNQITFPEWLQSDDCQRFLDDRRNAGLDYTWVQRLRIRALRGEDVKPDEFGIIGT